MEELMKRETKPRQSGFNDWFAILQKFSFLVSVIILALTLKSVSKTSENIPLKKEPEVNQSSFNESQDRDYVDWKRIRSAIEHENMLVNHRLSWLGKLQGLLFAAFGVILNVYASKESGVYLFLLFVIGFLGMLICFFIWVTLKQAQIQLKILDCWWYCEDRSKLADKNRLYELIKHYPNEDLWVKKLPKHPPLQVYKPRFIPEFIIKHANDYNIPFLFILGWVLILTAVWLRIV